jgi:hypothetical protein
MGSLEPDLVDGDSGARRRASIPDPDRPRHGADPAVSCDMSMLVQLGVDRITVLEPAVTAPGAMRSAVVRMPLVQKPGWLWPCRVKCSMDYSLSQALVRWPVPLIPSPHRGWSLAS